MGLYFGEYLGLPSVQAQSSPYHQLADEIGHPTGDVLVVTRSNWSGGRVGRMGIDPRELGLYLDSWVGTTAEEEAPPAATLLSRQPVAGREVLRTVQFTPDDDSTAQRWLLLGRSTISARVVRR